MVSREFTYCTAKQCPMSGNCKRNIDNVLTDKNKNVKIFTEEPGRRVLVDEKNEIYSFVCDKFISKHH